MIPAAGRQFLRNGGIALIVGQHDPRKELPLGVALHRLENETAVLQQDCSDVHQSLDLLRDGFRGLGNYCACHAAADQDDRVVERLDRRRDRVHVPAHGHLRERARVGAVAG
jgi:hypothetical protein